MFCLLVTHFYYGKLVKNVSKIHKLILQIAHLVFALDSNLFGTYKKRIIYRFLHYVYCIESLNSIDAINICNYWVINNWCVMISLLGKNRNSLKNAIPIPIVIYCIYLPSRRKFCGDFKNFSAVHASLASQIKWNYNYNFYC